MGIVVVEAYGLQAAHILCNIALAKEGDNLATLVVLDKGNGCLPVAGRNAGTADVVAAVAINVGLVYPELQAIVHGRHQCLIIVVELPHIVIAVGVNHLTATFGIVLRMGGHPSGISSCMVRHPVEPYLHIQRVGSSHEILEVADGAIGRICLLEIGGGIGAVDAPATRIDGHEPHDVDTQRLEVCQLLLGSGKGTFGGE